MTDNRGSRVYALRRLRRERPDLLERVVNGDISAHAAMVEAGFSAPRFTIAGRDPEVIAIAMRRNLPDEVIQDLVQLLHRTEGDRMTPFKVGDIVQMPGVPFVVEVLELGVCEDVPCDLGGETFRFKDPGGQGDDWMHSSEFVKVSA